MREGEKIVFADSVNLMWPGTHAHHCLTQHPSRQRREVYTRPFCRRAGDDGEPPPGPVLLAEIQVVLFFFLSFPLL